MSTVASRPASEPRPRLIVLMGVCGCGKSAVGAALAERLGAPFLDGDDFHPASNVQKMSRGEPLTDRDREPWLRAIGQALAEASDGRAIAACSALRRAYRETLTEAAGERVLFVLLDGSRALIAARMQARPEHFMPLSLLDSQLATLERPGADELAVTVDIGPDVEAVVASIASRLAP